MDKTFLIRKGDIVTIKDSSNFTIYDITAKVTAVTKAHYIDEYFIEYKLISDNNRKGTVFQFHCSINWFKTFEDRYLKE